MGKRKDQATDTAKAPPSQQSGERIKKRNKKTFDFIALRSGGYSPLLLGVKLNTRKKEDKNTMKTQNTNTTTQKQQKYIAFLKKQLKEAGATFENRTPETVAESSAYIGYLLKMSKQQPTKKTTKTTKAKQEKKSVLNWEELRTRYNVGGKENPEKAYLGGSCWEGANCKIRDNKERRRIINNALKEIKKYIAFDYSLSVRASYYDRIEIKIFITEEAYKNYENITDCSILGAFNRFDWFHKVGGLDHEEEYNIYKLLKQTSPRNDHQIKLLKAEYIELDRFINDLVASFEYNYSNSMVDYFDFNISASVSFEQKDTERARQASERLEDLANHWNEKKHELHETTEEESELIERTINARREKWEKERAEQEAKRAKEKAEQEARLALLEKERQQKEAKIARLFTDENIEILDIQENYFLKVILSNINKLNTIEEFEEEINNGHAHNANMIIERIINFKDIEALEIFKSNLLRDWVQLLTKENGERFGGAGYWSEKDKQFVDLEGKLYYTDEELKERDLKVVYSGILIQLEGKDQFVIEPEGFTYARYAGILAN